jgi:hypothetical protein
MARTFRGWAMALVMAAGVAGGAQASGPGSAWTETDPPTDPQVWRIVDFAVEAVTAIESSGMSRRGDEARGWVAVTFFKPLSPEAAALKTLLLHTTFDCKARTMGFTRLLMLDEAGNVLADKAGGAAEAAGEPVQKGTGDETMLRIACGEETFAEPAAMPNPVTGRAAYEAAWKRRTGG